ncbi:retrotransposon protein, putative, ty1-copia subclass [Tanacetum coccineum]
MPFTMRETYVDRNPKPISPASPIDSEYLRCGMRYMIHTEMKNYVELERLGYVLPQELSVGLILNGLTETSITWGRQLVNYMLCSLSKGKANGKGKDKQVYIPKPKNPKPSAKEHPAKDDTCHHCKEVGHCKRNCPAYLAELIKKKKQVGTASSSDVFIIELFSFPTKSWVYDTSCDNCHYALSITRGVVSVHRLVKNGFVQRFTDFGISVSKNNVHYFNAIPSNGIYEIDMHNLVPNVNSIYNVSTKRAKHNLDSTYLWHYRHAHMSKKRIEKLQQEVLLKSTDDESFDQYVSCLSGKMTRKSFPHRPERATDLLGIIHTDVCGPLRHVSKQGASYFITSTDDYSHDGYVYLLKHKHEVFETFKVFKNAVENQLGKIIKALRSDRCGEYISQEFKDYLKACGIVQQLTPPYIPQHNGVFERRNSTLLDMVRSMMNLTTLPLSFWDYALKSATRILNMVPIKKGCEALVKRDTPDKLQQRSVKCIFIGYPKETMGYYFYFPSENKIVVARYAEFFEKNLITQEVEGFETPQEEEIPICRSERTRRAPNRLCLNVEAEEYSLGDLNEPPRYKAAILVSESNKWIDAMIAEIQSMMDNIVWVLVDLPPGCKTIGNKWIFKKKTDMDGIVHTYKARLVAKGYTQLYEVDYEETFSPVADIRAIRILISIAAYYDYEIWKMDIKTAFLNGYLDEDIYMVQPKGFVDPNHPRKASGSNVTFLILYVDDIIIMGNHIPSLQSVKDYLGKCFAMKDLGEAAFILGIKIYKDRLKRLIRLGQNAYMDKILKRYRMDNSKRGHILMQERLDLNKTQGASTPEEVKRMQNVPYASVNPGECHKTTVKNILKYLRNTIDMFLVYGGNLEAELRVDCYCNAGFETDIDDMKFLTGYVSF